MPTFIALLRGVNVGGRNRVPMKELRDGCANAGLEDVRSYVQSGNVVFTAKGSASKHEVAIEGVISEVFGLDIPVVVRKADQWVVYAAGNPFPDAAEERPGSLHLALSKEPPKKDAATVLEGRAAAGERVRLVGDALWVDYFGGAGRSKLSPAVLDRAVGSSVTARNWRTVTKLADLAGVSV